MSAWKRFVCGAALSAGLAAACAADDGPGRIAADVPDRAGFDGPGKVLVLRCGSLDCHGSDRRNYRLFGYGGARLDPAHRPDMPDTTSAELAIDYDATVGIEPERTRAVASGTASLETMTLVRKARGVEHHAGGVRTAVGTPADLCVAGWLKRAPNADACAEALAP